MNFQKQLTLWRNSFSCSNFTWLCW